MMSSSVLSALGFFLAQTPLWLVWVAGLVIAVKRWQKHPPVSRLTVIALVILLVNALGSTLLNWLIPMWLAQQDGGVSQIGLIFTIRGFIQSLLTAAAFGLLLAALFGWRKPAEPAEEEGIPFLNL